MEKVQWSQPNLHLDIDDLKTELSQLREEGRTISKEWMQEYERLVALPDLNSRESQQAALALLDSGAELPHAAENPFHEPSDLAGIRAARPQQPRLEKFDLASARLEETVRGGWLGRMAGCLLGKPVEGWMHERLEGMLKATSNWPLQHYMPFDSVPSDVREKYNMQREFWWIDTVDGMPEDDDINYSFIGKLAFEHGGAEFSSVNIANIWLRELPAWHTYTAERVAMRNFLMDIEPPDSALYRNPYREWIGAQIRADFFGWAAPGNPERAAEWAWRDARVSHYKNGICGEMWVAAMLAAAAVLSDVSAVIQAGLAQVPANCRLATAIHRVMDLHEQGLSFEEFVADFRTRWDDAVKHHWCHTISNAEIVTAALLWGNKDFGRTICMAVQPGLDTDCNGATAGSVLGVILGASALPREWIDPLGDKVTLGLVGYHTQSFDSLMTESVQLIRKL